MTRNLDVATLYRMQVSRPRPVSHFEKTLETAQISHLEIPLPGKAFSTCCLFLQLQEYLVMRYRLLPSQTMSFYSHQPSNPQHREHLTRLPYRHQRFLLPTCCLTIIALD